MTLRYSSPGVRARLARGELIPWVESHKRANYVRMSYLALVPWADRDAIRAIYAKAKLETLLTGVEHVVDHKIPLNHPLVCGLTVPDNLRVIPHKRNCYELNHWGDRIADLFTEPEQLRLIA